MTKKIISTIMDSNNEEASKPLRKSVATNCSSDLSNLHTSSSTSSSSTSPSSTSHQHSSLPSSTSETEMLNSVAASEVRIFRNAKNRLESFRLYNWPREDIDTRDLAEAGFFLPKVRQLPDEVECIYCRVKVGNWSPGINPFLEHLRHSPRCDFMSGYIVGNIPLGGTPVTDPIRGNNKRIPNLDVCGSFNQPPPLNASSSLSQSTNYFPSPFSSSFPNNEPQSLRASDSPSQAVDVATRNLLSDQQLTHRPPKYTNLVTTQARLNTYPENWLPQLCPISAIKLCEAGFFYSGPLKSQLELGKEEVILQDVVTCFHCGRKVFNWSIDDDPWNEHFRLNSDCYFLELNYRKPNNVASNEPTSSHQSIGGCDPEICSGLSQNLVEDKSSSSSISRDDDNGTNKTTNDPLSNVSEIKDELNTISSQEKTEISSSTSTKRPSSIASDESKGTCKVCYLNEVELLFLPCKHASCCGTCAASVTTCPLCRTPITGSIRIFLS